MEAVGLIETDGGVGQGVDQERSDTDDFRNLNRAEDGISQQSLADALSLPPVVDGEAAELAHHGAENHHGRLTGGAQVVPV